MRARRLFSVALGLLSAGLATAVFAVEPADSFKAALVAMDREQWWQAVNHLKSALSHGPVESGERIKLYGMRFERYLPYYWLGVAHYREGDCHSALAAFRDSMAASAVRGVQRGKLGIYEEVCRQKLNLPLTAIAALPPSAPTPSSTPGGSTTTPGFRTAPASSTPVPVPAPTAPPTTTAGARQDVLAKHLREAETALKKGEALVSRLSELERSGHRAFRENPDFVLELRAAERRLSGARFLLDGSHREADVESAEKAKDDAKAAVEVLELVAQRVR